MESASRRVCCLNVFNDAICNAVLGDSDTNCPQCGLGVDPAWFSIVSHNTNKEDLSQAQNDDKKISDEETRQRKTEQDLESQSHGDKQTSDDAKISEKLDQQQDAAEHQDDASIDPDFVMVETLAKTTDEVAPINNEDDLQTEDDNSHRNAGKDLPAPGSGDLLVLETVNDHFSEEPLKNSETDEKNDVKEVKPVKPVKLVKPVGDSQASATGELLKTEDTELELGKTGKQSSGAGQRTEGADVGISKTQAQKPGTSEQSKPKQKKPETGSPPVKVGTQESMKMSEYKNKNRNDDAVKDAVPTTGAGEVDKELKVKVGKKGKNLLGRPGKWVRKKNGKRQEKKRRW